MRHIFSLLLSVFTFCVCKGFVLPSGQIVSVCLTDEELAPVAQTALDIFASDLHAVLGARMAYVQDEQQAMVVCKVDTMLPQQGYHNYVSNGHLYVTGGNAHGLAYGLMEVSRLMGVSPWEEWLDVKICEKSSFALPDDYDACEFPAVPYRGIFINDEDWGLLPWATHKEPAAWTLHQDRIKGAVGPGVTEQIFRLMLRLRLNYYWPPMHECTQPFFLTEGNREVARRYGIYIGGSHCEPMASSAAAEWGLRGEGEYNYVTNRANVQRFWQERLDSVKGQEIVYTLGMRGVHDGAMQGVKTREEKVRFLQQVIDDQRQMLASTLSQPIECIPQVFVPYKEVLDVYRDGLSVPDDVTLMWTDDNYGYIRHFPDETEAQRKGGNGLYYHVSYWGRPHDYCWLSTLSPYLMEQQLTEAYHRGIRQMWMLNVGDIKPAEVQIQVFAALAWSGVSEDLTCGNQTDQIICDMMDAIFGSQYGRNITNLLDASYRRAWDRKPEHLAGTRVEEKDRAYWNLVRPVDYWNAEDIANRLFSYTEMSDEAETLARLVGNDCADAYFQLVKYPVQAAAQQNIKYLCPDLSQQAHDSIQSLTRIYNKGIDNGSKWDGIMSASPRGLRVFQSVSPEELPRYSDSLSWLALAPLNHEIFSHSRLQGLGTNGWMISARQGVPYQYVLPALPPSDSLELVIRLLPTHPVDAGRLSFTVAVDDGEPQLFHYETYDRSEEWKRNVLRNLAERRLKVPEAADGRQHVITFTALTENVVLNDIGLFRSK